MTADQIRAFLGWCAVINYAVLVVRAAPGRRRVREKRTAPDQQLSQVISITAHDYRRPWVSQFRAARKRVNVSFGESVRIIRELQGLSQNQRAERTGR